MSNISRIYARRFVAAVSKIPLREAWAEYQSQYGSDGYATAHNPRYSVRDRARHRVSKMRLARMQAARPVAVPS